MNTRNSLRSLLATLGLLVTAFPALAAIDFSGVEALANRLGGTALTAKVSFTDWTDETGDKAQIIPGDGAFTIRATSVHAASLAMGVYLRDVAKGHISWCGKRMPSEWPIPTETIDVAPRYPHAMAYNYCTLSYTMAYWSKEAWQEEIDRLALSGYTTALCMAGVQKIWKLTMEELGYTEQQQHDFIVDDAQQAWWLMGNLQAIGNGTEAGHYPIVSDEEIENDAEIGQFIVREMRAVGIEPVLQGFIGLVPSTTTKSQLATHFGYDVSDKTKVNIFVNGYYNEGHKNPDLIDPTCKVFEDVSAVWNKHLKTVYGMQDEADYPKYLGGDLFHESSPPASMSYTEQVNCTKFIQKYQQDAFPGVTWVLQNWQSAPVQSLRDGLDPEHTIIQRLDQTMSATDARTANYKNNTTGKWIPWVWVEVMNFGGNTGMHGAFRRFRHIGNLGGNTSFKGYGLLSEGLETNPVSYDMYHWAMVQSTQAEQNIDDGELEPWLDAYRQRRYGHTDANLKAAHTILANTVWTCKQDQQGTMESVFCAKPAYNLLKVSAWGPTTGTPYDRLELVAAARLMLASVEEHPELLDLETFRYDFVEIFQQLLADKAREILPDCENSKVCRDEFRRMLELLDSILACSNEWRLDAKEARLIGKAPTTGPAAYRRMITTWTPGRRGQTQLSQYAHRSYAGLVKNYYAKKWNAFFDVTEGAMTSAAYTALCADLDANFPYTDLMTDEKKTPAVDTLKPVDLAKEILLLVDPPAYNWNGAAGNGLWDEGDNWIFNSFPAAWVDNNDAVVTTASALEIAAQANISVENLEVRKGVPTEYSDVPGCDSTTVIKTSPITVFKNQNIADLANWEFTAKMGGGGWFDTRVCAATAYGVAPVNDAGGNVTAVTAQFQCVDQGWLKVANVRFEQSGSDIVASVTQVYGSNGGKQGTVLTKNNGTNPAIDNYPLYNISAIDPVPTSLALSTKIAIKGLLKLGDRFILKAPEQVREAEGVVFEKGVLDVTEIASPLTIVSATVGKEGGSIRVPDACTLTISDVTLNGSRPLVIRGRAANLTGVAGSIRISVPQNCVKKLVYVSDDDPLTEQALELDDSGYLKHSFGKSYTKFLTGTPADTGWTGLTLDDISRCAIYGRLGGSWVSLKAADTACGLILNKTADALTVAMQYYDADKNTKSVTATFTIGANGHVFAQASDPRYTEKKYAIGTATLATQANKGVVATSDSTAGYGIAEIKLATSVAKIANLDINFVDLGKALDVAANLSDKKSVTLSDYAELTKSTIANNINLTIGANGYLEANGDCTVGTGVALSVNGTLDLTGGAWTFGTGSTLTVADGGKTVGTVKGGTLAITTASPLTLTLAIGGTLDLTGSTGSITIIAPDEDHKITTEGQVYTCVEKDYRYRVTNVGEISVNMPGKNYETLAEALEAGKALQDANPGEIVNIWVLSQEVEKLAQADIAAWNTENHTSMSLFGDGNGIVIKDWNKPVQANLKWNYAKTYWESTSGTDDNGNRGQAYRGDTLVNITDEDIVEFPQSTSGCIYINKDLKPKMLIKSGATVTLGKADLVSNVPTGAEIEIEAGGILQLSHWQAGCAAVIKDCVITGGGKVTIDTTKCTSLEIGNMKGNSTLEIPANFTVTVTDSIKNPIAGSGTIKISGDKSLTFAADSAVTVQHESVSFGYFATTSVVANPDGTTTKTYTKVELAKPTAFGKSWTNLYIGPETSGDLTTWNYAPNWAQVNPASIARKTTGIPYASGQGAYTASLFDGDLMSNVPVTDGYKKITADSELDFWQVLLGVTNGVDVTINQVEKLQRGSGAYIYVDPTSKLTIKKVRSNKGDTIDLHSAAPEGIVFEGINGNVWNFYLEGEGTVKFDCQFSGSAHKLKYAEVEIGTGDSTQLKTKKLVSFSSREGEAKVELDTDTIIKDTTESGVTMTAVESFTGSSPAGSYKLRTENDGVYLDYMAKSETRPLLVWDTTKYDLTASSEVYIEGTKIKVTPTADDTIVFDKNFTTLGTQHFFIQHNPTTMKPFSACRNLLVKDGVTLHVGFANTSCNIPDDMNIVLEGSAKLVLTVWGNNTKQDIKIGSNTSIIGGTVLIDTVRATALETGDLDGNTTLVIPQNFTVTAKGDVNVTLSGSGTLKASNLGVIHADANWTGTVDVSNVATHGMIGQTIVGLKTTILSDGSRTIEIAESANEAIMTSGGNLSEGQYVDPFGNAIEYASFKDSQIKPKIVLNNNYGIHYFGDTKGFNFAVRETDIYSMITGGSLAFGASDIEVQSGTLHLITSQTLRPGSTGWNPNTLNLADTFIVVGDSGRVEFTGTSATSPIVISSGTTLTLAGNINNISFTDIRFNSPNGTLMLTSGIGTIELKGENIIKTVDIDNTIDNTMTIKLADGATLACAELAEGKVISGVDGKIAKYVGGKYTLVDETLAIAYALGVTGTTEAEMLAAAQEAVDELVKKIDLAALVAGDETAALQKLNVELKEKGLVASLKAVSLTGASESTKLYRLVIEPLK